MRSCSPKPVAKENERYSPFTNEADVISTPKQPRSESGRDWYPYYAGYTEDFIDGLLEILGPGVKSVLDPWNGSGTTTAVCHKRGISCFGVDINPVLTVISRARILPCSFSERLGPLGEKVISLANRLSKIPMPSDPLAVWLTPRAAQRVRSLVAATHHALEIPRHDDTKLTLAQRADALDSLGAFMYTALFAATRDLLSPLRATNPTWLILPKHPENRIDPSWDTIDRGFMYRIRYFAQRLKIVSEAVLTQGAIRTASATDLPFKSRSFSAVLTSPPYATRIDYVRGVAPELAILGANAEDLIALRQASTGSPVVRGVRPPQLSQHAAYAASLLRTVSSHPTKGSRHYYEPWLRNYFSSLLRGLHEVHRVVVPGGYICVTVQNSHYKEVLIDLQRIVVEFFSATGYELALRRDFEARQHRARMNPRARKHLENRRSFESLLVFSRSSHGAQAIIQ